MLKKNAPWLLFYGVVALALGGASAWPLDSATPIVWAAINSLVVFATLFAFLSFLPGKYKLPTQILFAMFGGVAFGWLFTRLGQGEFVSDYLNIFGALFVLLLKVVIIPLIFVSVLCGVAGFGDLRKLGSIGVKTILYFLSTTAIAVTIGIILVTLLRPGAGHDALQPMEEKETVATIGRAIQTDVLPTIIQNPIMPGQSPIAVIFVAILLGAALATLAEKGAHALRVFQDLDRAFVAIIQAIMFIAPLGVFTLLASVIAELGVEYLQTLATYVATVMGALVCHFLVLTCVLGPIAAGVSPRRFLRGMLPAFEVSFSTSSSAATLPVTIHCVTKRVGANENIANFVLPIGATTNMDGTACYVSIASIFIAQVYGIDLSFQQQVMVFLTAILVSVGTAGIPGASIGLIGIILNSIGAPLEGLAIVIGVDRILDMSRTVVNITGDSMGACVISRSEGLLGQPEE